MSFIHIIKKNSVDILCLIVLGIILLAYVINIIPPGFKNDDFVYLYRLQGILYPQEPLNDSLFHNAFSTVRLFEGSSYYRPLDILIWGSCYKLFGLWDRGYSYVSIILIFGMLVFFYKTIALLSSRTIAFITAVIYIFHCSFTYIYWFNWFGSMSKNFFLWMAIYFIVKSSCIFRKRYLFLILIGTWGAICSKESSCLPLLILLSYYAFFHSTITKRITVVYVLFITLILTYFVIGPAGFFRDIFTGGKSVAYDIKFVWINFNAHMDGIFSTGLPILVLPALVALAVYSRSKRFFLAVSIYAIFTTVLLINSSYTYYYLLIIYLILIMIEKRYWIWAILSIIMFIVIIPFYLKTEEYHYDSFCFALVFLGATFFNISKRCYPIFLCDFMGKFVTSGQKINLSLIIKYSLTFLAIGVLLINAYTTIAAVFEKRKPHINWTKKRIKKSAETEIVYNHIIATLYDSVSDNSLEILGVKNARDLSQNAALFLSMVKNENPECLISWNPDIPPENESSDVSDFLQAMGINLELRSNMAIDSKFMKNLGKNLVEDGGFENSVMPGFVYSTESFRGNNSAMVSKSNQPYLDKKSIWFPALQEINISPGIYIFGGRYKSNDLQAKYAGFEVVDRRSYQKGCWRTNSINGTSDWKMLAGIFQVEDMITIIPRPFRISNYSLGDVFVDDLFLIRIAEHSNSLFE